MPTWSNLRPPPALFVHIEHMAGDRYVMMGRVCVRRSGVSSGVLGNEHADSPSMWLMVLCEPAVAPRLIAPSTALAARTQTFTWMIYRMTSPIMRI